MQMEVHAWCPARCCGSTLSTWGFTLRKALGTSRKKTVMCNLPNVWQNITFSDFPPMRFWGTAHLMKYFWESLRSAGLAHRPKMLFLYCKDKVYRFLKTAPLTPFIIGRNPSSSEIGSLLLHSGFRKLLSFATCSLGDSLKSFIWHEGVKLTELSLGLFIKCIWTLFPISTWS